MYVKALFNAPGLTIAKKYLVKQMEFLKGPICDKKYAIIDDDKELIWAFDDEVYEVD